MSRRKGGGMGASSRVSCPSPANTVTRRSKKRAFFWGSELATARARPPLRRALGTEVVENAEHAQRGADGGASVFVLARVRVTKRRSWSDEPEADRLFVAQARLDERAVDDAAHHLAVLRLAALDVAEHDERVDGRAA